MLNEFCWMLIIPVCSIYYAREQYGTLETGTIHWHAQFEMLKLVIN